MDLKHIIPQQRRRTFGPALDIQYSVDRSNVPRVGPTPVFTRASSGTFVNENRRIVGKTTSTTSLNPASVPVGGVAVFAVPSGSVVGWLNNSVVSVMVDSDGNDQIGSEAHVTGTLIHKTDTTITLLVTSKVGTATVSSWFVSYRGQRIDHDPATGRCLGTLVEEGRTNLYSRSENFSDPAWGKNRSTVQSGFSDPSGGTSAFKLIEDTTASNTHTLTNGTTPPATAHTLSVFAKKGERTWIVLRLGGANTFFNLDNGTIAAGSVNSPTITNFGNGWYRCTVTSSAGTQGQFWLATNSTTTSYTGDGTSGLFIWGAQLEAGLNATSYIPTTATSVARSVDVGSITGALFSGFYNQSEGVLFSQSSRTATSANAFIVQVSDNSFNNSTDLRHTGATGAGPLMNFANVNQLSGSISGINISSGGTAKQSFAYRLNDCAYSGNGGALQTDSSVSIPTVSQMSIGSAHTGNFSLIGTIAAIRYYRNRLPNAQLQTLTAIVTETIVYNGVPIWYNGEGLIETS